MRYAPRTRRWSRGLSGAALGGLLLFGCYAGDTELAASEWLNPCAAKTLNPCLAKTLNPCAAKTLNPCAAKKAPAVGSDGNANPCNP